MQTKLRHLSSTYPVTISLFLYLSVSYPMYIELH